MQTLNSYPSTYPLYWHGSPQDAAFEPIAVRAMLLDLDIPLHIIIRSDGEVGVARKGALSAAPGGYGILASLPSQPIGSLGDPAFRSTYGVSAALYAGAMANGIASEEMLITLGKTGLMGSFGAGGLSPSRVETAIRKVQAALPDGPYAFNLLHSPFEPAVERRTAELYVQYHVPVVEASAFLDLSPALVHYRASGLSKASDGSVQIHHRVIAKISRKEVARRFMEPAPADLLNALVNEGRITPAQAELAGRVPVADDITVEADSGGHTDNRPLVCLIPTLLTQRDAIQAKRNYPVPVRIGAGGGIGTPAAALAAFMMGAAYVVTGSINQACLESGAAEAVRRLLAQTDMADVTMAPAADMFEMGVRVQVVKRGTMFAMRAAKLYELYTRYNSLEEIPPVEREKLEKQVFRREIEAIWQDTLRFFSERDPKQIERAEKDPHQKMALVFRWYLGLSSRWAVNGEPGREMDYQVWCGPAMGAFNDWVRGTPLAEPANRHVAEVNWQILTGAAYLARLRMLGLSGVRLPASLEAYTPA
ncbi:MAG TPA: PfaD family polyunsaturated fatty acid/polyketide biosynthesis protein [Anaerolineaceae bacterium]